MRFEELSPAHAPEFLSFVFELRERDSPTFKRWFDREWNDLTFARFAEDCAAARLDWRPKAKQTSSTLYLLVGDDGVDGVGILRFPLSPAVEATGGNLVFIVRPTRRGRGLGPVVLNRLLFEGARAGLARALVTCAPDNGAARRSIELNRGAAAGTTGDLEKFWIPLR